MSEQPERLNLARDALLAGHNKRGPSKFDILPVELFSIIFAFYISDPTRAGASLVLGAVCKKWRQIAWPTPSLWSTLSIRFSRERRSLAIQVELVREWLRRVRRRPLSITMNTPTSADPDLDDHYFDFLVPLMRVLTFYCDQWYILDLDLPLDVLSALHVSLFTSSQLYKLRLSSTDNYEDEIAIPTLSLLSPQIVQIDSLKLDPSSLKWQSILDLTMPWMTIPEILRILHGAPNLERCNFDKIVRDETSEPISGYFHTRNLQLKRLEIGFFVDLAPFWERVFLPGLEDLHLERCHFEPSDAGIIPFISRSGCKLRRLSLEDTHLDGDDFLQICVSQPTLEELRLDDGCRDIIPFLLALSRHIPVEDDESSVPLFNEPLLPSLRRFEWAKSPFPWEALQFFLLPFASEGKYVRRPITSFVVRYERDDEELPSPGSPGIPVQVPELHIPHIPPRILSLIADFSHSIHFDLTIGSGASRQDAIELSENYHRLAQIL